MVKLSSFLISSAICIALHGPLLAMEDDTSKHLSAATSSISAAPEPSWIYMDNEDDNLICSFLQSNLAATAANEDLAKEDKKALARIKAMNVTQQIELITDLDTFFKNSTNLKHTTYVKNVIQSLIKGILESSDYQETAFSYQLNFLKAISSHVYGIDQQVTAFKSLQTLLQEGQKQDLEKRTTWRDKMLQDIVKKDGVLLLVGEAYQSLPNLRAAGIDDADILKALQGQEKLKNFSAIELLGAFLQIRDGFWGKDE